MPHRLHPLRDADFSVGPLLSLVVRGTLPSARQSSPRRRFQRRRRCRLVSLQLRQVEPSRLAQPQHPPPSARHTLPRSARRMRRLTPSRTARMVWAAGFWAAALATRSPTRSRSANVANGSSESVRRNASASARSRLNVNVSGNERLRKGSAVSVSMSGNVRIVSGNSRRSVRNSSAPSGRRSVALALVSRYRRSPSSPRAPSRTPTRTFTAALALLPRRLRRSSLPSTSPSTRGTSR